MLHLKGDGLPRWRDQASHKSVRVRPISLAFGVFLCCLLLWQSLSGLRISAAGTSTANCRIKNGIASLPLKTISEHLERIQDCSISNILATNLTFLETAYPPPVSEFVDRRHRLAQALTDEALDAFIVEPGYTFSYFANVTQQQWEVWEPEERPFLMVVHPGAAATEPKVTFLVPSFEEERARLLGMPFEERIETVTYEEHWNPYRALLESPLFAAVTVHGRKPKVMVDEEMRDFIARGLSDSGFDVIGLGGKVEQVRQTKSEVEIGILRAVNTGTVEALRAMRECLTPGLTEDEVMFVLDNTLRSAGLDPFFDIVLFDEDASNPHGGTDGAKKLEDETMVLIDVGAHLFGYSSDICRSFFPPFFTKPESVKQYEAQSGSVKHKLDVWDIVFAAQTASLSALHENSTAAAVDIAARSIIEDAGYGEAFTHRVGHGIGIKARSSLSVTPRFQS